MRSFFAISLVVVAGCGDNLEDSIDPGDLGGPTTVGVEDDGRVPRLVPEVCAAQTWPDVVVDAKDLELRVVQMAEGAGVLGVPRGGGPLRGFLVDGRGEIIGDRQGTLIRDDGAYTSVAANVQDGRLVVGLIEQGIVKISVLRADLGAYVDLAKLPGELVGDAAMLPTRDQRVAAVGGSSGMVMGTFDSAWAPMGTEVFARSVPTSMTSATYGLDAMVAWSTANQCHLERVASGIYSVQDWACRNGRLATDYASRGGELVFEQGEGLMLSNIRASGHNEIANSRPLVPLGHAPRIAFDGERFWVSYLSSHGDVVVGYLDDQDTLVSVPLADMQPAPDAYDLAFINGAIEVYAFDPVIGFTAQRLCLRRE